jgi:hypothetical protein
LVVAANLLRDCALNWLREDLDFLRKRCHFWKASQKWHLFLIFFLAENPKR